MCVNTFNKNALSCSWYKPLNTDILFQSVTFSSTSRMSTCVHLNLCSVLLCFKRFDSRSHFSTACLLCLSAMLLLTSSFFPWKAQIFTWKKASADSIQWLAVSLLGGAHRSGAVQRQWLVPTEWVTILAMVQKTEQTSIHLDCYGKNGALRSMHQW